MPRAEAVVVAPLALDLAAVTVGALSGALTARQHRFDVAGVLMLALVTGLGGGLIRDLALRTETPLAFTAPALIPTALLAGLAGLLLGSAAEAMTSRFARTSVALDGATLALYAVLGADRARAAGLPVASCVLIGVLAGTGGGILRDVIVNEPPVIFRPGSYYALLAAAGCLAHVVVARTTGAVGVSAASAIVLIFLLRQLSHQRGWVTAPADTVHLRRPRPLRRRRRRRP